MKIKELYYGDASETLVIALKNLGAVQAIQKKNEESMATLDRAITVAKRILDANKVKDKALFKQHVSEIIFLLQTVNE